jgi:hypothetical protein
MYEKLSREAVKKVKAGDIKLACEVTRQSPNHAETYNDQLRATTGKRLSPQESRSAGPEELKAQTKLHEKAPRKKP